MNNFNLKASERSELLSAVSARLEAYYSGASDVAVAPSFTVEEVRSFINNQDFDRPLSATEAAEHIINGLSEYAVHTPDPMYFGLYNPRTSYPSAVADYIAGVLNPQLAAWSHAPFANEVEQRIIRELGAKFGYKEDSICGTFASGGAEANMTAILCALFDAYPDYAQSGLRGCKQQPVIYCSAESHHSVHKASKLLGLGLDAVRVVGVDDLNRMCLVKLLKYVQEDIGNGLKPMMVIGTAGTTGLAAIDDLGDIARICDIHSMWFHVDAAYGGGAILSSSYRHLLNGINASDSITFDAHKWMSVPMGGSIFLSSRPLALSNAFGIKTDYMPDAIDEAATIDPYVNSIQWSRRFIGLKVYMALLTFGWSGYDQVITHQIAMGQYLRDELEKADWVVANNTLLPVCCFTMEKYADNDDFATYIANYVVGKEASWVSTYPVQGQNTIRACVTNYDTKHEHIDKLISLLNDARSQWEQR